MRCPPRADPCIGAVAARDKRRSDARKRTMPKPTPRRARRLRLVIEPHAADELRRAVSERLDLFNVATTGLDAWHSVTVLLRDPEDELVGGLLADIWGGWLHVTYLWVAAPYRGHGHGGELLRTAERFA